VTPKTDVDVLSEEPSIGDAPAFERRLLGCPAGSSSAAAGSPVESCRWTYDDPVALLTLTTIP
jgi:hypothetical protein